MLSTQNYAALPAAPALQRLCQALAVLDAINSQDPEYRYFTYDPLWDAQEQLFEMNDGEGDQLLVLFRPEGCCINGLLQEYDQPDKAQVTRGLPEAFEEFMFGEPVNSLGTTFCLWYTPAHGWQTGVVEDEDDGSEELLFIFDGQPETYADWANEYFIEDTDRDPIDAADVARIYQHEPLTRELVQAFIDPLEDWNQLENDLQEIGYPYNFR
ncbi:hypothetical protein FY528_01030 [Hymenobacter lutimineralis]|uniref:Uncharacterized protein n=1 Tax=Hymenobacter lutimineralis TaxID=2606448 RepID=A0A5D6VE31_9BACT|nr:MULTISPECIES: hypothetical protein [Hymenobacter]QIX60239.1 hypothetical protein HER32_03145 [Hymenobacter sp. BT18]TYZ14341.1 hypothetical protein FY528_01030 [Hymenobacter lutimineralis]